MIDIDLEQEINSYLDELMERSDEYRNKVMKSWLMNFLEL
jgi:hypothetical protein